MSFWVSSAYGRLRISSGPRYMRRTAREPHRTEPAAHAVLADHARREVRRAGQVARGTRRRLAQDEELGRAPAEPDRERVLEVALRVQVTFVGGKLLGHPERLTGGQDRDLGDGVGVR